MQGVHLLAQPARVGAPPLVGQDHSARITCVLASAADDGLAAVTGSADRTIRCVTPCQGETDVGSHEMAGLHSSRTCRRQQHASVCVTGAPPRRRARRQNHGLLIHVRMRGSLQSCGQP